MTKNFIVFLSLFFAITGCFLKKSDPQGVTFGTAENERSSGSTVEFGTLGTDLIIHGEDKKGLEIECKALLQWSNYVHSRNSLERFDFDCSAMIQDLDSKIRSDLKHPSYSYGLDSPEKFASKSRYYAVVSNVFPSVLRDRHAEGKLRDAVCYNSALIIAGILPLTQMSRVPPPSSYFSRLASRFDVFC